MVGVGVGGAGLGVGVERGPQAASNEKTTRRRIARLHVVIAASSLRRLSGELK
jgi:hypothetical protein